MQTGLSAFSLTPMVNERIDAAALIRILARLANQPLHAICV